MAGAFGAHIDVKYAMVLKLKTECDLQHVSSAGKAAGTGAKITLLDKKTRGLVEEQVRKVEKIETAVEARFQEYFVSSMSIPNGGESTPDNQRKRRGRRGARKAR